MLARALQDGNFDLVDPRLQKNYDAGEMIRMITCAAACVRHSSTLRPRMSQVCVSFSSASHKDRKMEELS